MDLEPILVKIWLTEIKAHYSKGLICSERNLQAEFYHHLRIELNKPHIRIWIEPTLTFEKLNESSIRLKPDILITIDYEIVCILELKYNPPGEVHFKHDLGKLFKFSQEVNNTHRLLTNAQLGEYTHDRFSVSPEILTCFAVVCNEKAYAARQAYWKNIQTSQKFLLLTGVINRKELKFEFQKQINDSYIKHVW